VRDSPAYGARNVSMVAAATGEAAARQTPLASLPTVERRARYYTDVARGIVQTAPRSAPSAGTAALR
jgi:hypothetical protein